MCFYGNTQTDKLTIYSNPLYACQALIRTLKFVSLSKGGRTCNYAIVIAMDNIQYGSGESS